MVFTEKFCMPSPNPDLPAFDRATLRTVKRALISVSDKSRLLDQARALHERGVKLVSTGGTHKAIAGAGIPVKDVSELTQFPEMMDGRVKTLHPMVHGGLLGDRDLESHKGAMHDHGILSIDLLVVNLYPFEAAVAQGGSYEMCVENIDIGGPAMIRGTLRQSLAAKTYARSAAYDAAIANWFAGHIESTPAYRAQGGTLKQELRYGENPHQSAAFYADGSNRPGVATAEAKPAVAIIKHANPCGVAVADDFISAYKNALACDPVSAFGGIVALNGNLDAQTAKEIVKVFTEVVIAPTADEDAIEVFRKKQRNVAGGILVQDRDNGYVADKDLKVVTKRKPTESEMADLRMAWKVAKHVKSNAIIYVKDGSTAGIGAGQMSRIDSARIAARKAEDAQKAAKWDEPRTKGCACASDAFFPFPDGMLAAASAGASCVIQPGGSIRDAEVIAAADEAGLAMVFTGMRHFRH